MILHPGLRDPRYWPSCEATISTCGLQGCWRQREGAGTVLAFNYLHLEVKDHIPVRTRNFLHGFCPNCKREQWKGGSKWNNQCVRTLRPQKFSVCSCSIHVTSEKVLPHTPITHISTAVICFGSWQHSPLALWWWVGTLNIIKKKSKLISKILTYASTEDKNAGRFKMNCGCINSKT